MCPCFRSDRPYLLTRARRCIDVQRAGIGSIRIGYGCCRGNLLCNAGCVVGDVCTPRDAGNEQAQEQDHHREKKDNNQFGQLHLVFLYVKLKSSPLDKGPEPEIHWLEIVGPTRERLSFPHGLTDSESSSFPGVASEQDWSSESHASSDTV